MRRITLNYLFITFVLIFTTLVGRNVSAQETDEFRYCIAAKLKYTSGGDCNNSAPVFENAEIGLNLQNSSLAHRFEKLSDINIPYVFDHSFYYDGTDKLVSNLHDTDDDSPLSLIVHTHVSNIKNDNDQTFTVDMPALKTGVNISEPYNSSDPCHNVINIGGKREYYEVTATIIIDDPIHLTNSNLNPKYCLENESLKLHVGSFYSNSMAVKPVLEVTLGDDSEVWKPLNNVIITPNSDITLTYQDIAGKKDQAGTKYFDWMGRTLKFRVKKTLIDNKKSTGMMASGIVFYPLGIQYTIHQTSRSYCSEKVKITVELDNEQNAGYLTLNSSRYQWVVKESKNNSGYYNCTMEPVPGSPKLFNIYLANNEGVPQDPFNADPHVSIEWQMQLQDKTGTGLSTYFCIRTFSIPAQPPSISIAQRPPAYTINGIKYDVPDYNHPFAMIDVDDSYVNAKLRQPYKIMNGDDVLLTLNTLPTAYNEMSQHQKDSLDAIFVSEFNEMKDKPQNPYRSFFDLQYKNFLEKNKTGFPINTQPATAITFANDGSFFLYNNNYRIFKVDVDGVKVNNGFQKTSVTTYWANVMGISPDNSFMLFARGQDAGLLTKAPLAGNAINNGINSSLRYWSNCLSPDGSWAVGSVNNTLLYKVNTNDLSQTQIYSGTSLNPQLAPDGSFLVFWNGNGFGHLQKALLSNGMITSVSEIALVNPAFEHFAPDGSYLICTNTINKYLIRVGLTGANIGKVDTIVSTSTGYVTNVDFAPDGTYFIYSKEESNGFFGIYKVPANTTGINNGELLIQARDGVCDTEISPDGSYVLFTSYLETGNYADRKLYKHYLNANQLYNKFYPNNDVAKEWYNTYKEKWISKRLGIKITKGIVVNNTMNLRLVDGDNCSYPFNVFVKAPTESNFSYTTTNPSSACAKDGSAVITYHGGGSTPFVHPSGTLSAQENSITVTGLGYGDNDICFTDAEGNQSETLKVTINSTSNGIKNLVPVDQTCPNPNGSVSFNIGNLPGEKTFTLTNTEYPFKTFTSINSEDYWSFTGLYAGTYNLKVKQANCDFTHNDIKINGSQIFDIVDPIATTNATTLDGTGTVTINFQNRTNAVYWGGDYPSVFNSSESNNTVNYAEVTPKNYNLTATHGTCTITKSFTIDRPQFNDSISLEETNGNLLVASNLFGVNSLLSPYKIRLLDGSRNIVAESSNNANLLANIQTNGSYIINLQYGTGNNETDLYSFNFPLGTINNIYSATPPTCPGGEGSITISPTGGIDGTSLLVSTDGLQFSAPNIISCPIDKFSYFIKSEKITDTDINDCSVTVTKSLIEQFDVNIPDKEKVSASKRMTDVTCAGSNNGSAYIENLAGGSGNYLYTVDSISWEEPTYVFNDLAPGNHKMYLKDSENDCPVVPLGVISIDEPDSLKIESVFVNQPTCELKNGLIKVEIKGGNEAYTYEWLYNGAPYFSSGEFSEDSITNLGDTLASGLYHLNVTDTYNCRLSKEINLNQYFNPAIEDVSVTDVKCYGESNGSATILSTTGTKGVLKSYIKAFGFVYNDTIKGITQAFDTLKKSRYEIYAIDSLHCRSNSPYIVSINQPDTLLYLIVDTIIPVVDKGSSSGSIKSIVYGGNDGLKNVKLLNSQGTSLDSSWQRNDFAFFFPRLKAGNYNILVSDHKGCSFKTSTLKVNEPDTALGFRVTAKQNALCKSQTGSITVQGYGGWGGYKYKRASYNSYYSRNTFEPLYAGNYFITVQDSHGATHSDTVMIYEPKDSLKSWITKPLLPTCFNNGGLQLSVLGGTAPYSVLNLTTNNTLTVAQQKTVDFYNLSAGKYTFNVTDSNGCHFDLETQLPDTGLLEIVRLDPVYPSGVGTSDGAIKATIKGGRLPYSYHWKQRFGSILPEVSSTLNNIPSGHYQLNVSETGGCSDTAYLYLPGINDIAFHIAEVRNETSYLAHNGYCTLTSNFNSWQNFELITSSGNPVLLNPSDSTANFYCKNNTVFLKNLSGGDYFISGVASSGETVYAEFRIEPYIRFYISDIDIVNVDTIGGSNGRITVVTSGGGGNNRFAWEKITASGNSILVGENYPESSILSNVAAGNYRLIVTDRYNNAIYDTIVILEPGSPLTISIAEYQHESCKTYEDAYILLHAEGGWGDYQFRDDNTPYFANGNMFYNLDVRKHDFYLTDKKGITRSISFSIVEPDYLTSHVSLVDSVNCKGVRDGNIGFKVKGGTQPYRFMESAIWTQDTIAHNIPAGWHTYLFTDSNNCTGQDTLKVYMPEPDSLLFNRVDVIHTTCNTDNGSIKINLQGGTKPYRYEWLDVNNAVIGSDTVIQGLQQNGYYMLNVYDWHNCAQHLSQRIKPSVNPLITNIGTTPTLCYGDSTGIASVIQILPGTPYAPCNFTWSNKDTGKIAHGYPQGTHFVTISDTNHCSTAKYFEITQPDSLWVTVSDRKNAHCYGYNDGFLVADGRGGVGGYHYHWSTGDTISLANNLYKGGYTVSITDANGCNNEKLFTIAEPDKLLVTIGDDIKMCPGNSYTLDGKAFATHKWSSSQGTFSNERYVTVKDENNYYLEVTDSIGCFAHDTINVSIGNDALRSDFLMSSQASNGDTLKLFELSNMSLDSLRWSFNDTVFSRVANTSGLDYMFLLKAQENGIYNIDLYAFSGGCVSKSTKQIEITGENIGPDQGDELGYKDPLIISLVIAPNPNNGNFRADIKLREVADIDLVLFTVSSGLKIDERFGRGQSEYSIDYNFSQLNSGLYLLILKAKEERKQIKILIQY